MPRKSSFVRLLQAKFHVFSVSNCLLMCFLNFPQSFELLYAFGKDAAGALLFEGGFLGADR